MFALIWPVVIAVLGSTMYQMENLTNLNQLVGLNSFWIFALPLKLEAEASQVRSVAVMEGV